jgi:predicted MFS family arabinose efflux permease
MVVVMPWRPALAIVGGLGLVAGIGIFLLMPSRANALRAASEAVNSVSEWRPRLTFGFPLLCTVGVFDSATRMAFLTFLPFVLTAKGAGVPTIGLALALVFAGGAVGKLVCAFIGARIGVFATILLTEALTAVGITVLLPLPLEPAMALLPLVGIALNGTSSVLYGSVPLFVAPQRRSRAFGFFYTATIGAGACSPIVFGFVGDAIGVPLTVICVAATALATLPLALALRPVLEAEA